jgi:hypothetical protein
MEGAGIATAHAGMVVVADEVKRRTSSSARFDNDPGTAAIVTRMLDTNGQRVALRRCPYSDEN